MPWVKPFVVTCFFQSCVIEFCGISAWFGDLSVCRTHHRSPFLHQFLWCFQRQEHQEWSTDIWPSFPVVIWRDEITCGIFITAILLYTCCGEKRGLFEKKQAIWHHFDYVCLRAVGITQELLYHASRKLQTDDLRAIFNLIANLGITCDSFSVQ